MKISDKIYNIPTYHFTTHKPKSKNVSASSRCKAFLAIVISKNVWVSYFATYAFEATF